MISLPLTDEDIAELRDLCIDADNGKRGRKSEFNAKVTPRLVIDLLGKLREARSDACAEPAEALVRALEEYLDAHHNSKWEPAEESGPAWLTVSENEQHLKNARDRLLRVASRFLGRSS